MKLDRFTVRLLLTLLVTSLFTGCSLIDSLDDPTPTGVKMEGVWEVTGVYNEEDSSVNMLDSITLGYANHKMPIYFSIQEDGTVASTAGPLILYIVYGDNNYTNFFGKLDEVFNYADLKFTNGQFRIQDGTVNDFELQMKVMPPSLKTLTDILTLFGVNTQKIKTYLLHRFYKVEIDFPSILSSEKMEWRWKSPPTYAKYFVQGNSFDAVQEWVGWPANKYTRCKISLVKRVRTLTELVKDSK